MPAGRLARLQSFRFAWIAEGKRRSDRRGQAPKGTGGMPRRHQMVGVEGRDRSGGAAQRASIPEFSLDTRGTETSQYPEEEKSTETPSVAASERGRAQTGRDTARGCGAGAMEWIESSRSPLENGTRAGDSPVGFDEVLLSGTQVGSGT